MEPIKRNNITYTSYEEAKNSLISNALGLLKGELGVAIYQVGREVKSLLGVGTGVNSSPVNIINDTGVKVVHVGNSNPPPGTPVWIWGGMSESVNPESDENKLLQQLYEKINRIEFAFQYGMDCGDTKFTSIVELDAVKPIAPGYNANGGSFNLTDTGTDEPTWIGNFYPNVRHFIIKHDTAANLRNYRPKNYELVASTDTNKLYMGIDGKYREIQLSGPVTP